MHSRAFSSPGSFSPPSSRPPFLSTSHHRPPSCPLPQPPVDCPFEQVRALLLPRQTRWSLSSPTARQNNRPGPSSRPADRAAAWPRIQMPVGHKKRGVRDKMTKGQKGQGAQNFQGRGRERTKSFPKMGPDKVANKFTSYLPRRSLFHQRHTLLLFLRSVLRLPAASSSSSCSITSRLRAFRAISSSWWCKSMKRPHINTRREGEVRERAGTRLSRCKWRRWKRGRDGGTESRHRLCGYRDKLFLIYS